MRRNYRLATYPLITVFLLYFAITAHAETCQVNYLMGVGKTGDRLKTDCALTATATISASGTFQVTPGDGWLTATSTNSIATSTALTAVWAYSAASSAAAVATALAGGISSYSTTTESVATSTAYTALNGSTVAAQNTGNALLLSMDTTATDIASDTTYIANNLNRVSGRNMKATDTSFVVGDSPVLIDVNVGLGRNGRLGFLANDGAGNFYVEISDDGTNYGGAFEMTSGEVFLLDGIDIDTIRITFIANSSYRCAVWP